MTVGSVKMERKKMECLNHNDGHKKHRWTHTDHFTNNNFYFIPFFSKLTKLCVRGQPEVEEEL